MTYDVLYTLGSVVLVSAIAFVGIFSISLNERRIHNVVLLLVALAVGALLGDAFIHLIPEAFEHGESVEAVSLLIIVGMLIFFALEKLFSWHHGQHEKGHGHTHHLRESTEPLGRLILVSDGLHNLMDGMIIASSYSVGVEVGVATTIAVILHEIPQEVGDFGVLLHAGYTRMRALFLNFLSGLLAVVGAVVVLLVGEVASSFAVTLLPVAAGSFIYIASSDLTPELHKEKNIGETVLQFIAILIGIVAMYGLLFLE